MKNGSILVISNNKNIGQKISNKIKLLRVCDTIQNVSFLEAISVLNSNRPKMILLYWQNTDSIEIVKEIRSIRLLDKVPIIFVTDNLIEDTLFKAFDYGIDEFFNLEEPDSIILMRVLLTLKKSILYRKMETNNEIMTKTNIIDKKSGIYSSKYLQLLMNHFFNKCIENNIEDTIFMYFKPVQIEKKFINLNKIGNIIKTIPRGNDIVFYSNDSGFYFILYNCSAIYAKSIAQRIKKELTGICNVYINATEITDTFDKLEPVLIKEIESQIVEKKEFNFLYNEDIKNSLKSMEQERVQEESKENSRKKLYTTFEKVAIPVFYYIQTVNSEIYPDADIRYEIKEDYSTFSITKSDVFSKITITFNEYNKYIFDIIQDNQNNDSTEKRLSCNLENFNDTFLTSILKDFIKEFFTIENIKKLNQTEKNAEREE